MFSVTRHTARTNHFVLLSLILLIMASWGVRIPAAEDPDIGHIRSRTVAISVRYHDGQEWKQFDKGLGTGYLIHQEGFVLTSKHVAPDRFTNDPAQRNQVEIIGRIGDRSSPPVPLTIVDVHPSLDVMLLKFERGADPKALDFFYLTDKGTTPVAQVTAAGFPASTDGRIRLVTAFMRAAIEEGSRLGEVNAKLEGGFSGGPVISADKKIVGTIEKSSTAVDRDTFNFVPVRSFKNWLADQITIPVPPVPPPSLRVAKITCIGHLHDDDSGDLFGGDEDKDYSLSGSLELTPGGPSKSYADKDVVDNEVRIEVKLNASSNSDGDLVVSGELELWEGPVRWTKDDVKKIDPVKIPRGATKVIYDGKLANRGGDWATAKLEIQNADK